MEDSCALDIADRSGATLDEVGILMNVCRERVRQIEESALDKIKLNGKNFRMLMELYMMMKTDVEEPDSIDLY